MHPTVTCPYCGTRAAAPSANYRLTDTFVVGLAMSDTQRYKNKFAISKPIAIMLLTFSAVFILWVFLRGEILSDLLLVSLGIVIGVTATQVVYPGLRNRIGTSVLSKVKAANLWDDVNCTNCHRTFRYHKNTLEVRKS